jgi:hypothetical protein
MTTDGGAPGAAGQDPGQGDGGNPGGGAWYGEIADEGLRGWAQNKNFENPEAALSSYHNLEKMFGADRAGRTIEMPKSDADQAAKDEFFNKLGRPESSDKYDFGELPENADSNFVDWARSAFHQNGLTDAQAKAVVAGYNEFAEKQYEQMAEEATQALDGEKEALKKEWGAAYDDNIARGKEAAREFGLEAATLDAMEKSLGYSGVMKFMADIGSRIGEGGLVGEGDTTFGGSLTPAQAQARMDELRSDKTWMADYLSGSKSHVEKWDGLMKASMGRK